MYMKNSQSNDYIQRADPGKNSKICQEIEENDVLSTLCNSNIVSPLHQTETSSIGSRFVVGNFLSIYLRQF